MAFSNGKRIEDETSKRIVDLAVNIGCREGADALTVTRLCRELNCDRRVIYNRFRDIDEINLVVAQRCNEELMAKAKNALKPQASFEENFITLIKTAFTYIYEKNSYFQHYTALYKVTEKIRFFRRLQLWWRRERQQERCVRRQTATKRRRIFGFS